MLPLVSSSNPTLMGLTSLRKTRSNLPLGIDRWESLRLHLRGASAFRSQYPPGVQVDGLQPPVLAAVERGRDWDDSWWTAIRLQAP